MTWMELNDDSPAPKRGDIVQTNIGDRRERTWLILRALPMRPRASVLRRYRVWMARWWQLEPEMRMALFWSAARRGGQGTYHFKRFPAKKKQSFEQYMRRKINADVASVA